MGTPPGGLHPREARQRRDAQLARDLLRRGRPDAAIVAADAALADTPTSLPALRVPLDGAIALGRTGEALRAARAMRALGAPEDLTATERRLVGQLLVDETDWAPGLASSLCSNPDGPSLLLLPATPDDPDALAWVDRVLASATAAGLRPVVVQVISPAHGAATDVPRGVEVVRVELGSAYPKDAAPDRRATDRAWASASAARALRPARIIALVAREQGTLATGLALQAAIGCQLVAVVREATPGDGWPGTSARRLGRADLVVAAADASGPAVVEALRGIATPGVLVPGATSPGLRDPAVPAPRPV